MSVASPTNTRPERLYFVQWLRVLLICLVVAQHSAEPYVTTGGDWLIRDPASSELLLVLFVLSGTYFMGFFFLISAYFLDASISRHGAVAVVRSRLVRLGIPLIVFVIFINGAIGYAIYGKGIGMAAFLGRYLLGGNLEFGPLWFIAHLLIYSLVYVALRRWLMPLIGAPKPPGHRAILVFAVVLGVVTAVMRYFYPIDDWERLFWLVPTEPGRLPQYVGLFAVGIVAGRGKWFTEIDSRVATIWFAIGIVVFAVMAILELPRLALPDYVTLRVIWGFLEAFVCVGMVLGLTVFFRRFLAGPGTWLSRLDGNVYGVYLIHVYLVMGFQAAVLSTGWPALAKFFVVALASIAVSLVLVSLLRRIPVVRRVV